MSRCREDVMIEIESILKYLEDRKGEWVTARRLVIDLNLYNRLDHPGNPNSIKGVSKMCTDMAEKFGFEVDRKRSHLRRRFRMKERK